MVLLVELGNRHSSRASALSYSRILQLVFLFRILSVCGRWWTEGQHLTMP